MLLNESQWREKEITLDTSEKYILMCEKAKEIQDYFDFKNFEFRDKTKFSLMCSTFASVYGNVKGDVWLPRQDQLQILSGLSWIEFDERCIRFALYNDNPVPEKEQIGIQVIMKEKYGKIWDSEKEEWVK